MPSLSGGGGTYCELEPEALDWLATGAWILGTGGGGDPYHSLLNIKKLYGEGHRVRLVDPGELADEALVAVVSHMGAPLVNRERLPDPAMITRAVRLMEAYLGRPFDAVMSMEIGGSNAFQPLLVAALTGLPVVDADGMGRAFPSVFHTSFAVHDLGCAPFTMVDIRGNEVVLTEGRDWLWMERISRRITTEFGSRAFTCKAPRTGREVRDCGVPRTVTQAIRLGRAVHDARRAHVDPIRTVLETEGGKRLFRGKVLDIERRPTEGFLRGRARLEGLEEEAGERYLLEFQNEFLLGYRNDALDVMVPDLICLLDTETGAAIGTEALRYGQRVTVAALPAPAVFLTQRGLDFAGPRAFGYDLEFRSKFERRLA